jgi:nicotinamidase/pyrazinamidase
MNKNIQLLIIDPQNDFCDIPAGELPVSQGGGDKPALPVTGADADMKRLANLIERMGGDLNSIHVTMDSHNPIDIAHPTWWAGKDGKAPAPFTVISVDDVQKGVWKARDPAMQDASAAYVSALADNGRYLLIVWPEHCLIGSWGHNVHASVKGALDRWARKEMKVVDFVTKGTNPNTEHYSAIQAEVPDATDPSTQLNQTLIDALKRADTVVIAGEALSHCVASTVRDIADNIGAENVSKLVLLTDCASSVPGFEKQGEEFVKALVARGMRTATSATFSA